MTGRGFITDFYIVYLPLIHCFILMTISIIALRALEKPELIVDSLFSPKRPQDEDKQIKTRFDKSVSDADAIIKFEQLVERLEYMFVFKDLEYRSMARLMSTLTTIKNDGHGKGMFRLTKSYESIDDDIQSLNEQLSRIIKDLEEILFKLNQVQKEITRREMSQISHDNRLGLLRSEVEAATKRFSRKEKLSVRIKPILSEKDLIGYHGLKPSEMLKHKEFFNNKIVKLVRVMARRTNNTFNFFHSSPTSKSYRKLNKIRFNINHLIRLDRIERDFFNNKQSIRHSNNSDTFTRYTYNYLKINGKLPAVLESRLEGRKRNTYKRHRNFSLNVRTNIEYHNNLNKLEGQKKLAQQLIKQALNLETLRISKRIETALKSKKGTRNIKVSEKIRRHRRYLRHKNKHKTQKKK